MTEPLVSPAGVTWYNPWTPATLRAYGASTNTSPSAEAWVEGFGAFREMVFDLSLINASFTGGTNPTVQLTVWVQRQTPGEVADDLLALKTGALTAAQLAALVSYQANYVAVLGPTLTPRAVQDGGGSPPFGQQSGWASDSLRVKHQLTLGGDVAPSAASVNWALLVRGR